MSNSSLPSEKNAAKKFFSVFSLFFNSSLFPKARHLEKFRKRIEFRLWDATVVSVAFLLLPNFLFLASFFTRFIIQTLLTLALPAAYTFLRRGVRLASYLVIKDVGNTAL